MSKVLVIFGSKSDAEVSNRVVSALKENNVECESKVCSAHRNPDDLHELLKQPHDIVIAGAGLAAALPGAVAAKTIRPVIGVPCNNNYKGLDSLLSIAQMPPGIPVLAVGVDKAEVAAKSAALMLKQYTGVNIVADEKTKAVEKAIKMLNEFGIDYTESTQIDSAKINLVFVYFDEPIKTSNEFSIYCPMLLPDDDKAEAALNLLKHSDHGLWVGLNRGDNAALAAIEIMGIDGKYDDKLGEYRNKWNIKK